MNRTIDFFILLLAVSNFSIGQETKPENLTCQQAFALIQNFQNDTNFVILDLSTQAMFEEAHIKNAIAYDVFSEGFDTWVSKLNKNKIYLLYCTRGHRSGIALEKMKQM